MSGYWVATCVVLGVVDRVVDGRQEEGGRDGECVGVDVGVGVGAAGVDEMGGKTDDKPCGNATGPTGARLAWAGASQSVSRLKVVVLEVVLRGDAGWWCRGAVVGERHKRRQERGSAEGRGRRALKSKDGQPRARARSCACLLLPRVHSAPGSPCAPLHMHAHGVKCFVPSPPAACDCAQPAPACHAVSKAQGLDGVHGARQKA